MERQGRRAAGRAALDANEIDPAPTVGKQTRGGAAPGGIAMIRERVLELRDEGEAASQEGVTLLARLVTHPADVFAAEGFLATGAIVRDRDAARAWAPMIQALPDDARAAYDAVIKLRGGAGLDAAIAGAAGGAGAQPEPPRPSEPSQPSAQQSTGGMPPALLRDAEQKDDPPQSRHTAMSIGVTVFKGTIEPVELKVEAVWASGAMKQSSELAVSGPSVSAQAKAMFESGQWKPKVTTDLNILRAGAVCQVNGHPVAFSGGLKLAELGQEKVTDLPTLSLLKLSGSATVPFPDEHGKFLVQIKADASLPASALFDPEDLAKLEKLIDDVDELEKLLDESGKFIDDADNVLDAAKARADQLVGKPKHGGKLSKNSSAKKVGKVSTKAERLLSKMEALDKLRKSMSPVARKLATRVINRVMKTVAAKVVVAGLRVASRLVPVVGWTLAVYDVLEVSYCTWRYWRGDLRFDPFGDGEAPSIWDGFGEYGDREGVDSDGDGVPDVRLPPEKQAELKNASGAKKRLFDAMLPTLEGVKGELEPRHLIRLLDITDRAQLTDAMVDEIMRRVGTGHASPDAALDALEAALALAGRGAKKGSGSGDRDGDGDGGKTRGSGSGGDQLQPGDSRLAPLRNPQLGDKVGTKHRTGMSLAWTATENTVTIIYGQDVDGRDIPVTVPGTRRVVDGKIYFDVEGGEGEREVTYERAVWDVGRKEWVYVKATGSLSLPATLSKDLPGKGPKKKPKKQH